MRDYFSIRFDMESVDHDPHEAALLESAVEAGLRKLNYVKCGTSCDGSIARIAFRRMSRLEETDDCRRIK